MKLLEKYSLYLILLLTFIVYSFSFSHDFVNWDDEVYVIDNQYIKDLSLKGIKHILTAIVSNHYHPLTLFSLAIDYHLWGLNPMGYIITNVLLHLLNVFLVFKIILLLSKNHNIAIITTLLFAIHPFKVESVVWISERKDVLYAFFYLFSILFYIKYLTNKSQLKHYYTALLLFCLALLAKATAVSLPLILLLLDYAYNRIGIRTELKKIIIEKIPFFTLSLLFGIIAIHAQSTVPPNDYPIIEKFFLVNYAISFYIIKFFAPVYQNTLIPFPASLTFKYYASASIIPLLLFLIYKLRTIRKTLIIGLSLFIIPIILLLIKFPIGPNYLAERYTYIPYIGLAYIVAFLIDKYFQKKQTLLYTSSASIVFIFVILNINYQSVWKNSYTLFTNVLKRLGNNSIAFNNLGTYFEGEKKANDLALTYYNKAINHSQYIDAYYNRGRLFNILNQPEKALNDLEIVIKKDKNYKMAQAERAIALKNLGRIDQAIEELEKLILDKSITRKEVLYNNLGNTKLEKLDYQGALQAYNKAIAINPNYFLAYYSRGLYYAQIEANMHKAINDFSKVIKLNPRYPNAYCDRGLAYLMLNQQEKGLADLNTAIKVDPDYPVTYYNLGIYYLQINNLNKACTNFQIAQQKGFKVSNELTTKACMK